MAQSYMDSIRQYQVAKGSVALWWLGQNGFLIKSPEGAIIALDAYLTNSCQEKFGPLLGINFDRKVPIFIKPEELDVDYFVCTHSHDDHADPETIKSISKEKVSMFVGPGLATETFRKCGVDEGKIQQIYAGGEVRLADVTLRGTFALPTDDSDLNHLGYFLAIDDAPSIYMTGDTDYTDLLGHVRKLEPKVMITCINGGFNNLSHWEAAQLAGIVKPKIAIPCHYDMFPDNSVDPQQFRASLRVIDPEITYQQLEYVKPFVIQA